MKIAAMADGPDLSSSISKKLGFARYVLIVDLDTMEHEAVPLSPPLVGGGAEPVTAVSLALEKGARAILAGYISPRIMKPLVECGLEIVSGLDCPVHTAVERYQAGTLRQVDDAPLTNTRAVEEKKEHLGRVWRKTVRQFSAIVPMLLAIVLLIGLFRVHVHKDTLFRIFSGKPWHDVFAGSLLGSLFTGNPINSYIIGDSLLEMGVSPYAIAALMVTWVTVGLVQLPAEIEFLGLRFALARNSGAFFLSLFIAFVTVSITGVLL